MNDTKYDGITITQDNRFTTISYDISEALNQKNPRNVFLNGQLFIEMQCDLILVQYFCKGNTGIDNRRRTLFSNFIKSRDVNFYAKIKLLKTLELISKAGISKLLDVQTYTSLKSIGAVRNAFHHNLEYGDALNCLTSGDKFMFVSKDGRKLSVYEDVETLRTDFISETNSLYSALHELAHKIEDQKNDY